MFRTKIKKIQILIIAVFKLRSKQKEKMSNIRSKDVIYTLIARKGKPLADYTDKRGSFDKFTKDVLQKLSPKPGQYILDYGK